MLTFSTKAKLHFQFLKINTFLNKMLTNEVLKLLLLRILKNALLFFLIVIKETITILLKLDCLNRFQTS